MAAQEFTDKIGKAISQGFVTIGLALGTQLGLFKALADLSQSKDTAVTTQQLADSINYKERYVREWVNGMVCGGIVDHAEIEGINRYWLEPYRLPALLGHSFGWPAAYSELAIAASRSIHHVQECYPLDGPQGTRVEDYPELHKFLAKRGVQWKTPENCKLILNDPELLAKLEQGINVLEIGCGAANPTKALATCFPNSTFVASDLKQSILDRAEANCKELPNVRCEILDACNIPDDKTEQFDLVMLFDVYHDLPHPQQLVEGALKLLKPRGQFLMNDIGMHESVSENKHKHGTQAALYYTISSIYCVPTSLNTPGGEGLGACAGMELFERRLSRDFVDVKRIGEDYGLYYLSTKG